jgi:hypothetical protein
VDRRGGDAGLRAGRIGVHSAGWWRLEQDRLEPPKDGEEPGDTGS